MTRQASGKPSKERTSSQPDAVKETDVQAITIDHGRFDSEHPSPERAVELLKALSHPIRVKILRVMVLGIPLRVSDIATKINEPANSVSYHLRKLSHSGIVEHADPDDLQDRRETWWVVNGWTGINIDPDEIRTVPGGGAALAAMNSVLRTEAAELFSLERINAAMSTGWPGFQADFTLRLTREEAQQLIDDLSRRLDKAREQSRRRVGDSSEQTHDFDFRAVLLPQVSSEGVNPEHAAEMPGENSATT